MEDQLISFKTAKLAKEKGFYIEDQNNHIPRYNLPTQSLLQKWLRELHNCFIEVGIHSPENKYFTKRNLRYFVKINYYGKNFNIEMTDDEDYLKINIKTYEEALEIGLQEALKLIK